MNKELAKIFYALSYYLEIESIPFKPQAYQKAAGLLESLDENIEDIYKQGGLKALENLPGIGKNIALKIEEYIQTGKIKMFEDYYRKIPVKIFDLLNINGLGPKTIYNLYKYLGIKDLKDLQIAIENNKIRTVPRLGVKTEMKLKKSLDFYNQKHYNLLTSKDLDHVDSDFGNLIKLSDIKGDLHIHTPRHSFVWLPDEEEKQIYNYIHESIKRGYKYIGISNHTEYLKIEYGLTGKELLEEKILIDKINADLQTNNIDFVVYHGCECNILKNGLLDIEDKYLKELDYVIVGIHSNFDLDNKSQTERIIRALENPLVNILAHPTGRLINKRDEYNIDFDKILALSTKNNKILEINASPFRLDLDRHNIAKAISHNITMIINTDSHNIEQLDFMKYGVAEARQGGATKNSILNTRPVIVF